MRRVWLPGLEDNFSMMGSCQPPVCWKDQGEGQGLKRVFYQPMRVSSAYEKKRILESGTIDLTSGMKWQPRHWAPSLQSFTTNIYTDGQHSLTETWGHLVPLLFLNPRGLALWPSEMSWTSLNLSFEPCGPLHPLLCSNNSSQLVDMPCFPLLPGLCFCWMHRTT